MSKELSGSGPCSQVVTRVGLSAIPPETARSRQRLFALRDVQHLLCRALQERFPLMCANLKVEGINYDNFDDMPFLQLKDIENEVHVQFERTTDMYFFDKRDRLPQCFPDPFDTVPPLKLDS